ncbi:MAG: potassium-transporting ATPase subunit KdpC [Aeromicrobium sp.]|nr:MAG: potassium-transporting ATPase subunit KdpC [Aeromicrobium sp.]
MFINTVIDFSRQAFASLRTSLLFAVLLGIAYPASVWGVGQLFGEKAEGQPIIAQGHIVGSALLGQNFEGSRWFHSRPSAASYDTLASAPSNLGPSNPELVDQIKARRAEIAATESALAGQIPTDAVTASGSGLDPHISIDYAELQAPRVAASNGLDLRLVKTLIEKNTDGRVLGFLGEPGVNVVKLNVDIAAATQ